ncbi:MAG: energy-coupling factor ABC transporter ATP-binding protein [Magnetococcus sp. YQC-5]
MTSPLMEVQKIRIACNRRLVCQEVSFSIGPGERLAVLGSEASGKSLLMRMMAGLLRPEAGRVLWRGVDLVGLSPDQRVGGIGVLFRDPDARFLCATPGEEVALTPASLGLAGEALAVRVTESLFMAGLEERCADLSWSELSASQRYRVGIAAVLAARPQLLLVDEPGNALSDVGEVDFARRLQEFGDRYGTAMVVFTSRDVRASLFAKRIVRLVTNDIGGKW